MKSIVFILILASVGVDRVVAQEDHSQHGMSQHHSHHMMMHNLPMNPVSAAELALKRVTEYSLSPSAFSFGQLPNSWQHLPESAAITVESGRGYYVVAVENKVEHKALFLRILLNGTVESANFTGKFLPLPSPNSAS